MRKEKLEAMLYGAFYGDAYSLSAHWVYDTEIIENACLNLDTCNNPISTYHPTKTAGDFTHYGDQMLWLLEDLAEHKIFSLVDFGERWYKNMQSYDGYIDGASKHTLKQLSESKNFFSCGSSSSDLSAVSRMFPIILKYHDATDDMQEAIKLHTIVTHMNKDLILAANFFSEVAIAILNGASLHQTIEESSKHFGENIQKWTQEAKALQGIDTKEAIQELGQSCSVDGAFASTIYILLKYKDDFTLALKENLLAGGESSARAMIIGAILGIIHHKSVLQSSIKNQMNESQKIESLIRKLS
ncbi:MAG: ADP-ribosylglycohydrolase [Sulfurimonas sp.]|uniref:ADP-ribosylglycohydrolase family protein n=1 Tax=Sulfurimonas sp. TaxID=2022749 RepID=UPI0039E65668